MPGLPLCCLESVLLVVVAVELEVVASVAAVDSAFEVSFAAASTLEFAVSGEWSGDSDADVFADVVLAAGSAISISVVVLGQIDCRQFMNFVVFQRIVFFVFVFLLFSQGSFVHLLCC